MPKYKVIRRQDRVVIGEVEGATSKKAYDTAKERYGQEGYLEVSLADREPPPIPEDLMLSRVNIEDGLRRWAMQALGFPEGTVVRVFADGAQCSNCDDSDQIRARVYVPKPEGKEAPAEEDPAEQVEGFAPGEAPEGGGQGAVQLDGHRPGRR